MNIAKKFNLFAVLLVVLFVPSAVFGQGATDSWVRFGVANQRNSIAQDEPINWVMRLGAHNAYESFAYGHDTDPNQTLTVTSQLDRGARIIAIDVHVLDNQLYLCHGDYCAFDKIAYDEIMEEIGNFISVRQDFVWVQIEYLPYNGCIALPDSECQDASMTLEQIADDLEASVITHLDRSSGLVWKPNEALHVGIDEFGNDAYAYPALCSGCIPTGAVQRRRYPTLRELRRHGKRAMITATGMKGCCGDDCGAYSVGNGQCSNHSLNAGASCSSDNGCQGLGDAVTWIWNDGALGGTISNSDYSANWADFDENNCSANSVNFWDPDGVTDGNYPAISTVSEDRTVIALSQGIGIIENEDMVDLARCNVGRINLDFFDRAMDIDELVCCWYDDDCIPGVTIETECPADDQRVARTIWSWAQEFTPDDDQNYAMMRGLDGRWVAVEVPQNQFHCACGVARTGEPLNWEDKRGTDWEVTDATGSWDECPALCEAEFGQREACSPNGTCVDLPPLVFGVPVNGFQSPRLYEKLQEKPGFDECSENNPGACPNAWLRFRRVDGNGAGSVGGWTQQVAPSIDDVEITPNVDHPLNLDFTIRIDNPDNITTRLLMLFDDGVSPFLDSPTFENGQTVYHYTRGFLEEGPQVLNIELYSEQDTSSVTGALYVQDTEHIEFVYDGNVPPTFVEVFEGLTRTHLQEICEDVCIGHLLNFPVRFSDGDDNFTEPPDCSTQQMCQRGVRVLYGDVDDSVCNNGTCTGPAGNSCTDDSDCGTFFQIDQIRMVGPGLFEFDLMNLYQEPGVFHGTIFINDGTVEVAHDFTIFNLEPSVDPIILPNSSGCIHEVLTGEEVTCSVVFVDSNADVDSYAIDVNWGDATPVETFTDISFGINGPHTHLAFVRHVFATGSSPNAFPIRVAVTDDEGFPPGVDAVCGADNVSPCNTDLDCGGTCRLDDGSNNGSLTLCNANGDCDMACAFEPSTPCTVAGDCPGGPCVPQICRAEDVCRHRNFQEIRYCLGDDSVICTTDADCGTGTCGGLFEIEVFQGNTPPIVCPLSQPSCGSQSDTGGDFTITQGQTLTRSFRIVDPDVGDTQSLSVRYAPHLPAEFPPITNNQFTLSHTYDEPGTFELVFRVSSSFEGPITQNSTGALSFLVEVVPPNEPPVINPVPSTSIYVTEVFTETVTFSDDFPADPWIAFVSYGDDTETEVITICDGVPPFCDFAPTSFDLEHMYAEPGIYNGSIFLTDQIGHRTTIFEVEVLSLVDSYEPNDSCASATEIQEGVLEDVRVIEDDEDWFSIHLGSGQELIIDVEIVEPNDFTEFLIWDDCTGTILDITNTLAGEIHASYLNEDDPRTVYLQVLPDGPDLFPGVFDITVSIESLCSPSPAIDQISSQTQLGPPGGIKWQAFLTEMDGELTQIDVGRINGVNTNPLQFDLFIGATPGGGPPIYSEILEIPIGAPLEWSRIVLSTPVPIQAGQPYTWVICCGSTLMIGDYPVPGMNSSLGPAFDYAFRTHVRPMAGGDLDSDGIADGCDSCPLTIPDAIVDEVGCPPIVFGDSERDGDVDVDDLAVFQDCVSGPGVASGNPPVCNGFDADLDGDVDLLDFAQYQRCFSGTDNQADPSCSD